MEELRSKSMLLTGYLEMVIVHYFGRNSPHRVTKAFCAIVTPRNPAERGCQLSVKFSIDVHTVYGELTKRGVAVSLQFTLLNDHIPIFS